MIRGVSGIRALLGACSRPENNSDGVFAQLSVLGFLCAVAARLEGPCLFCCWAGTILHLAWALKPANAISRTARNARTARTARLPELLELVKFRNGGAARTARTAWTSRAVRTARTARIARTARDAGAARTARTVPAARAREEFDRSVWGFTSIASAVWLFKRENVRAAHLDGLLFPFGPQTGNP